MDTQAAVNTDVYVDIPSTDLSLARVQEMVEQFRMAAKQTVNYSPTVVNRKEIDLVKDLLHEELIETAQAITANDMQEYIDGLGDLIYVAIGGLSLVGVSAPELIEKICIANQTRFREGFTIREDGKLNRSPLFELPDLSNLLTPNNRIYN